MSEIETSKDLWRSRTRNSNVSKTVQVKLVRVCPTYKATLFIFFPSSSYPLLANCSFCHFPLSLYQPSFHPTSPITYPAKMPTRPGSSLWDHKSDKDLLLAIIDNGALKGIDWKVISDKMVAKGYTFSHEACRYASHSGYLLNTLLPLSPYSQSFSQSTIYVSLLVI